MIDTTATSGLARTDIQRSREQSVASRLNPESTDGFNTTLRNSLSTIERRNMTGSQHRRLMDTCIEMESLFVARMLREMRKSIQKTDWLHGGFAEDVFTDMLYDEYALEISKNSNLGLARQLYEQMSRSV